MKTRPTRLTASMPNSRISYNNKKSHTQFVNKSHNCFRTNINKIKATGDNMSED